VYTQPRVNATHYVTDVFGPNPPPTWALGNVGFLVRCNSVKYAQIDPIVSPGKKSHHMHEFLGHNNVHAGSTTQSLANTPNWKITCGDRNDHSSYWFPTVYQNGKRLKGTNFKAYYRSLDPENCIPMPLGMRIVAGNAKSNSSQGEAWFETSGGVMSKKLPNMFTAPSNRITARVTWPSCWDGKHLDSPDHQSHLAYPDWRNNKCPSSHPVVIPKLMTFLDFKAKGGAGFKLSSGNYTTFHGDAWIAWHPKQMADLTKLCINKKNNCRENGGVGKLAKVHGQKKVIVGP